MNAINPRRFSLDDDLESKYEIIDVLGGGGMGRVLRARHRQLKRIVAIKLLQHDLRSQESVSRFLREARAAAQIRSVHVAHVMDAGILRSGQPYIVMEYLQGQDLSNLVALRGRLPAEQATGFVLQALEALAAAHSLHIIHRDIKPGNLFATRMLGGETSIKVVDFGLAKTSHLLDTLNPTVTERGAVLGTPSYMSPEQFVDANDVDPRADVWGIGATLFELLTGTPPFMGTSLPQVYTAVMHAPIPALRSVAPELPEGLATAVATCLMRDRNRRYATVAELAEALAPYAPESLRAYVGRIRNIVQGAREVPDSVAFEPGTSSEQLREPSVDVTSTKLSSGSSQSIVNETGAGDGAKLRVRSVIGAVMVLLLGLAMWTLLRGLPVPLPRRSPPDPQPSPIAAPAVPIPAEPAAPPPEPTPAIAPLPPVQPREVPNLPSKPRRPKVLKAPALKPSHLPIYEQYP